MKIQGISLCLFYGLITGCSHLFYYPTPYKHIEPTKIRPRPPEELRFASRPDAEDTDLLAWHFSSREKPQALVIQFHGNAQNISTHFMHLQWITTDHPFDLLSFDYPGYGGSKGKPNPKSTVEAGASAVLFAHKKWPQLPLIIVGESLGGAIALRVMEDLRDQQLPICAFVANSTFRSYRAMGRQVMSQQWFTWPLQWLSYVLLSDRYSLKEWDHLQIPTLVVTRNEDPVVHAKMSQEIYENITAPKQLMSLEGQGHVDGFHGSDRVENRRELLKFLENHCHVKAVK